MPTPSTSLPLDLTGEAASNKVVDELHTVNDTVGRTFALNYGSFYTESLLIKKTVDDSYLIPGQDYKALHLHKEASKESNKEVCSVVHVLDHIEGELAIEAQMVGGQYSGNIEAIEELIAAQGLNERPAVWAEILQKPEQFNPANHLHHLNDTFGWEGMINLLEQLRLAVLQGNQPVMDALYQYIAKQLNLKQQQIDQLDQLVRNYPLATVLDKGMAILADTNTPLTNSEKVVTPSYLNNVIKTNYRDRPVASGMFCSRNENNLDFEENTSIGHHTGYLVTQSINPASPWTTSDFYYAVFKYVPPVGYPPRSCMKQPIVGNFLNLHEIDAGMAGPNDVWCWVTNTYVDAVGDIYIYVYLTMRYPYSSANTWTIGKRFATREYKQEAYWPTDVLEGTNIINDHFLVPRWEGIHSIMRGSASGRFIVNFTEEAYENIPLNLPNESGAVVPATTAGLTRGPRSFYVDDNYRDFIKTPTFSTTDYIRERGFCRSFVPVAFVNMANHYLRSDWNVALQFWAI